LNVLWLGEACALGQRYRDAFEAASRALELTRQFNHFTYERWALRLLGEIACQSDPPDLQTADGHYRQALALAHERGMRPLAARSHAGLATLYRRTGRRAESEEHWQTASAMYREMGMTYWLEKAERETKDLAR